ncbi:MAG: serine/threonine-protein phosphatase [Deltaproteobacteria bacterium]|nr:serine/threonine-protein phosphatase [Deltaproteobacteria bacterium]
MRAYAFTDRGGARERNEDALLCAGVLSEELMERPVACEGLPDPFLGAVADGMGGGPGGAEAARAVLRNLAAASLPAFWDEAKDLILRILADTSLQFAGMARENAMMSGMGTAVAGLWARGDRALAFNCGDCRVYRIRHGYFDLITKDHSLVYELYAAGAITEEEMASHHLKHMLTSSVQDCPEPPRAFFREVPLIAGDAFLICSDGVWEALPRSEMERMNSDGLPAEAAARMASSLKGLGCRDNTTFLWIC